MELNPHAIAEERLTLAGEYSRKSEELGNILEVKAAIWNELRKDFKSDTACDRAYDATPRGIEEMKLRLRLKAIEKELSAMRSYLDVLNGEARNQW